MDDEEARTRLLDAAEVLFYAEGIQAVGMDRIRAESGVPLKRLYKVFPAKEALVAAYLERRDRRWMASLRHAVEAAAGDPVGAVFEWLAGWFAEPGFRGCAFLNAFGELGAGPAAVLDVVRRHKAELRALLGEAAGGAGAEREELAEQLLILVEGATAAAALTPGPEPARRAGAAATTLLAAAAAA